MAYHGMNWRQFDLSAIVIRLLQKVHLAKNVKMPTPELVERRRRGAKPSPAIGD
jgi:fatty-acid desaturase